MAHQGGGSAATNRMNESMLKLHYGNLVVCTTKLLGHGRPKLGLHPGWG